MVLLNEGQRGLSQVKLIHFGVGKSCVVVEGVNESVNVVQLSSFNFHTAAIDILRSRLRNPSIPHSSQGIKRYKTLSVVGLTAFIRIVQLPRTVERKIHCRKTPMRDTSQLFNRSSLDSSLPRISRSDVFVSADKSHLIPTMRHGRPDSALCRPRYL